jgi:hypothetical protein
MRIEASRHPDNTESGNATQRKRPPHAAFAVPDSIALKSEDYDSGKSIRI